MTTHTGSFDVISSGERRANESAGRAAILTILAFIGTFVGIAVAALGTLAILAFVVIRMVMDAGLTR